MSQKTENELYNNFAGITTSYVQQVNPILEDIKPLESGKLPPESLKSRLNRRREKAEIIAGLVADKKIRVTDKGDIVPLEATEKGHPTLAQNPFVSIVAQKPGILPVKIKGATKKRQKSLAKRAQDFARDLWD